MLLAGPYREVDFVLRDLVMDGSLGWKRVSRRSVANFPDVIISQASLRLLIRQQVRSFAISAFRQDNAIKR